jgi:hypothetical protein
MAALGRLGRPPCYQHLRKKEALCPHSLDQRADADDVHDTGEIIGKHGKRHLGADILQALHQEVRGAHPCLDGAKGVLHRLSPLAHGLWVLVEPPLNSFQNLSLANSYRLCKSPSFYGTRTDLSKVFGPISNSPCTP